MKLYPVFDFVILTSNEKYPIELIIENDEEKDIEVIPLIELEIENKTRMITVLEKTTIKSLGRERIQFVMKVPETEGVGELHFILEHEGRDIIRKSRPIAIVKKLCHEPLYVVFVWHHHQAPNFLPNGTIHSPWAFKYVYEGSFFDFSNGGPYNVHVQLHRKHPKIKDVDHLSPSLLEQWDMILNNQASFEGVFENEKFSMINETLNGFRKLVRSRKIELLGSMYAHTIQGFLIRLFTLKGFRKFIRELLEWEWIEGLALSRRIMGQRPKGAWTPEMFWSMELLSIYSKVGIKYTVLCEQHFRKAGGEKDTIYEPYILEDYISGDSLIVFFRDLELSDWISFNADFKDDEEADIAARKFIVELFKRYLKNHGKICVIALDGENWMVIPTLKKYSAYFLDRVWKYIESSKGIFETTTFNEYLKEHSADKRLNYVPYGSWILLSDKQWTRGVKDDLWNYVLEKTPWVEAYYRIIPEKIRYELIHNERTPVYRMLKAFSIALDSDYYWYGEEKVYQDAVKKWSEEAYKIAKSQLEKIRSRILEERNSVAVIELENNLDHEVELTIFLKCGDVVNRSINVLIPSHSTECVYIPILGKVGCKIEIFASKVMLKEFKL